MRLKTLTGLFLAGLVCLLVLAPIALGPVPKRTAPRLVKRDYSVRILEYLGLMVVFFSASAVGSILIIRKEREEYRLESLKNMQSLIEGSLKDKQKAQDGQSESS